MSLGIKSIWRARSRCCAITGLPLISRDPLPSRVPRPLSGLTTSRRFESTAISTPTPAVVSDADGAASTAVAPTVDKGLVEAPVDEAKSSIRPQLVPEESRNQLFKEAFREARTLDSKDAKKSYKAFVSKARKYPNTPATLASFKQHVRDSRRQQGLRLVWQHFDKKVPEWTNCFHLMKKMTPQWSDRTSMSAVRIILPGSWDIDVNNQNLEYVDSATGVLQKLRTAVDKNPSAVVLRGKSSVLAGAADEIVRLCKEAEVYELGEVGTSDYKTKQLWPTIEGAPNGGASLPDDKLDNIWVHKEHQPHWTSRRYEEIPKPEVWTLENFELYIASLTYGRIPAHLAIPLYGKPGQHGRQVDTEGIRIRLIMETLEDPAVRPFITVSVLKMAISLMAFKGGHRASASRLFRLAEDWGVPMDTDIFNIMLEGYLRNRDVAFFHSFLRRMQARYYQPNIRTWLLFLRLVKGDDERRQVIVAMYELGMFNHNATRKGIAEVMASHDAYSAFKAGKPLDAFLLDQEERYGSEWRSVEAMNKIIIELLRFHRPEDPRIDDCKRLIDMHTEAGQKMEVSTANLLLGHAATAQDWDIALFALSLLKTAGREPDQASYAALVDLCISARSPHTLGTVYFYGVLNRKLKWRTRKLIRSVLLRLRPDPFWRTHQPGIFPKDTVRGLEADKIASPKAVMSRVERIILEMWDAYTPVKSLSRSLELAYRSNDQPLHRQLKSGGGANAKVKDLVLKLKRKDGAPGNINVRLNGCFDPSTMIEGWQDKNWDSKEPEGEDTALKDFDELSELTRSKKTAPRVGTIPQGGRSANVSPEQQPNDLLDEHIMERADQKQEREATIRRPS